MKKLVYLLVFFSLATTLKALDPELAKNTEDLVINFELIEKFNQAEYTPEVDFRSVITNYSFEDTKLILHAYRSGSVELKTEVIDEYLVSVKKEMKENTEIQEYLAEFLTY